MAVGFGPGKVILLGEHGVVYGYSALAAPIERGVTAHAVEASVPRLDLPSSLSQEQREALYRAFGAGLAAAGNPKVAVTLESELPLSMGLGSSGALSIALARALLEVRGQKLTEAKVETIALEMEREFHGSPSGVDHTTSSRGQMLLFKKGKATVVAPKKTLELVVVIVGERASTRSTVSALRARQARWPARYQRVFKDLGGLAEEGAAAAQKGDLELLGDLMNMNHGLLAGLGLSSERLDASVHRLRASGALGAKLTGAGGDGGAVIGLFPNAEEAAQRLTALGLTCFATRIPAGKAAKVARSAK